MALVTAAMIVLASRGSASTRRRGICSACPPCAESASAALLPFQEPETRPAFSSVRAQLERLLVGLKSAQRAAHASASTAAGRAGGTVDAVWEQGRLES